MRRQERSFRAKARKDPLRFERPLQCGISRSLIDLHRCSFRANGGAENAIVSCRTNNYAVMKSTDSILATIPPYWIFNDLGN